MTDSQLLPSVPDREVVRRREERSKQKMKTNFDKRHGVVTLPSLQSGDKVWIPEFETSGTVIEETHPRSYRVQTEKGVLRRNRKDLISLPEGGESPEEQTTENIEPQSLRGSNTSNTQITTRSGRVSRAPERLMSVSK